MEQNERPMKKGMRESQLHVSHSTALALFIPTALGEYNNSAIKEKVTLVLFSPLAFFQLFLSVMLLAYLPFLIPFDVCVPPPHARYSPLWTVGPAPFSETS